MQSEDVVNKYFIFKNICDLEINLTFLIKE